MFKKLFQSNFKKNHPIWFYLLLISLSFYALGFLYLLLSGQISLQDSIRFSIIAVHLLLIICTVVLFIATILNIVKIILLNKQTRLCRFEKTKVDTENKKILDMIQ